MSKGKKRIEQLAVLHPDAAGVDIGAEETYVAVPPDRDDKPVRSFPTFTRDLKELADWLQRCGIRTVEAFTRYRSISYWKRGAWMYAS